MWPQLGMYPRRLNVFDLLALPFARFCRSALDEAADEDFHADFMPSSDDEADEQDDDNDDDLIEKPSRMPEPSPPKITPSGKSPSMNKGRAQNTDTSSSRLSNNGHEESKVSFELVESGEPDSDDEVETASVEFHTRSAGKDDACVTEDESRDPSSFLKEYMVSITLSLPRILVICGQAGGAQGDEERFCVAFAIAAQAHQNGTGGITGVIDCISRVVGLSLDGHCCSV